MKESFELNAVKDELNNLLTFDCRGDAIGMLSAILVCANRDNKVSVHDIFELNHRHIDNSWNWYGWTAEDIISTFISKSEDGVYRVNLHFGLMKRLEWWPSWNEISNNQIVKKEVLNEKPKEPKKCHEYHFNCDSSYHMGYQKNGTPGKNDYLTYSIHVDTTNPYVYYEIYNMADRIIHEAQVKEEEEN